MKATIIFTFMMLLLFSFVPENNEDGCSHCLYIQKYEKGFEVDPEQPKPYVHKDSLFQIQPIITNLGHEKQYQYFNEFRLEYKDLHYCSDSTKLTLYLPNDSIVLHNIRPRISCKITMWFRLNEDQEKLLSKNAVNEIKIENRVTDNIYRYKMTDPDYFTKVYKLLK